MNDHEGKVKATQTSSQHTNKVNEFKMRMTHISDGIPSVPFVPLKSMGFATARKEERDAFLAIPSLMK